VLADDGSGLDGAVLAGLDWAIGHGCCVVSMSLGSPVDRGGSYSRVFERVARQALAAGCLIVAPVGNNSLRPDVLQPVNHPANCPSIVAVGAVDECLRVGGTSCAGLNPGGGEVDVVAPGVGILSAGLAPVLHRFESGSSTAAPFAAGIAALMAEADPGSRGVALRCRLLATARSLPLPTRDVGAGLVQAP
jgi:subtilisin family serine protease